MRKKLNVGLYGQRGHQLSRILYDNEFAQISAVCVLSESFTDEIIKNSKNEIKTYPSLEEMLCDEKIDLISLCSPDRSMQGKETIMCLKAGKHVYAEKPAALSETELDLILKTAKECKREFHEMADTVYTEPYWSMRKLVRGGKLGDIVQIYAQKSYPMNPLSRPQDETTDGGLVRQAGIHAIRFIEHITGIMVDDVKVCQTHLGNIYPDKGLYTASSWMMKLSNGGVASACVNYLNPKGFGKWGNESVRIFGTEGMVEITDGGRKTHYYSQNRDEGEIDTSGSDCPVFFNLIAQHILYKNPLPMTLEEELHPLRVVLRAFDSDKEGNSGLFDFVS